MKGRFITFEGSEGCGKSTQSELLYQYLKKKGYAVIYLREPGGTETGEAIRKLLLRPKSKISPVCEMLLYMSARAEAVHEVIKPALRKGKIIICDRFLDSTLAYQGYGLGVDIQAIKSIGQIVTSGLKPDLTIFLDLSVRGGLKHRQAKRDRIERRPLAYHHRVRKGYLKLAQAEPERIKTIRVHKNKIATQAEIRKVVDKFLKPNRYVL